MKLAVLSEASADEAAIRILVDGLLGTPTEVVALNKFATRVGWQGRLKILPAVLKELYYQTDADALAFVLDSDKSPVHSPEHEKAGGHNPKCRLCAGREKLQQIQLRPRPGRAPLKIAVGLAVPSLEAWFRCGVDSRVTEAAWLVGLSSKKYPYTTRSLKIDVYGSDRPGSPVLPTRMMEEAQRLVGMLDELEKWFPNGFGTFASAVKSW